MRPAQLFTLLLVATLGSSAAERSEAEKFLPRDFDPKGKYETYSYDEFYQLVDQTAGINSSFAGQKVKVFAQYDKMAARAGLNRTRRAVTPSLGCQIELCNSMEPLLPLGVASGLRKLFGDVVVTLYFPEASKYASFLSDADRMCTAAYPCSIWVKGKAEYVEIELKMAIGSRKIRVAYVLPDEIRLYEGRENALLAGAAVGVEIAQKIYSFIPKVGN